jgi:hypothetical protein
MLAPFFQTRKIVRDYHPGDPGPSTESEANALAQAEACLVAYQRHDHRCQPVDFSGCDLLISVCDLLSGVGFEVRHS